MRRLFRRATPELRSLVLRWGPELGGTEAIFPPFPPEVVGAGINPRNPRWNDFRGTTITHPSVDFYVLGLAFDDLKAGGQTKEDLHIVDLLSDTVRSYMKGGYQAVNPAYSGTHRGPKPYFPPSPRTVTQIPIILP